MFPLGEGHHHVLPGEVASPCTMSASHGVSHIQTTPSLFDKVSSEHISKATRTLTDVHVAN